MLRRRNQTTVTSAYSLVNTVQVPRGRCVPCHGATRGRSERTPLRGARRKSGGSYGSDVLLVAELLKRAHVVKTKCERENAKNELAILWRMGLNGGRMKTAFYVLMGALSASVILSSCGECSCKGNSDYLRDVPVTRTQSFH